MKGKAFKEGMQVRPLTEVKDSKKVWQSIKAVSKKGGKNHGNISGNRRMQYFNNLLNVTVNCSPEHMQNVTEFLDGHCQACQRDEPGI